MIRLTINVSIRDEEFNYRYVAYLIKCLIINTKALCQRQPIHHKNLLPRKIDRLISHFMHVKIQLSSPYLILHNNHFQLNTQNFQAKLFVFRLI